MQAMPDEGEHLFIREDRVPRDTGKKLVFNICFNLMIERRFGVPLIRRRALFVCGDIRRVFRYAAVLNTHYIGTVQPTGIFHFLYASNVTDSAWIAEDLTERYMACFRGWQLNTCKPLLENPLLTLPQVEQFFEDHPNIDTGGFSWNKSTLRDRIFKTLDSFFESKFKRTYSYTDQDLQAAADFGVEIMLFDCPDGYVIKPVHTDQLKENIMKYRES